MALAAASFISSVIWEARPSKAPLKMPEALICDIFEDKYFSLSSPEELKKWVETGKRVWFIGNKEADLLKEWEEEGILSEEKQEFMLEVYWATLYRLYLDEG